MVGLSLFAHGIVIYGKIKVPNSNQKLSICFLQPSRFLHGKQQLATTCTTKTQTPNKPKPKTEPKKQKAQDVVTHSNQSTTTTKQKTTNQTQRTNIHNRSTSKNLPPLKGNLFSVAYP